MSAERKLFTAERQMLMARQQLAATAGTTLALPHHSGDLERMVAGLQADMQKILGALGVTETAEAVDNAEHTLLEQRQQEVSLLKTELRALAVCIEHTKAEIAALRPQDTAEDRLTAVASELDAVVSATESATDQILSAGEKMEALAREMRSHVTDAYVVGLVEDMLDTAVGIFEACNFQDLTGQRITKVVNTLKYVESRVNAMVDIWGQDGIAEVLARPRGTEVPEDEDAKLLNGPQLQNHGISQDEIDKLFG